MELKVEVKRREQLDGWIAIYSEDGVTRYAVISDKSPEQALFKLGGSIASQADSRTLHSLLESIEVATITDEAREEQG